MTGKEDKQTTNNDACHTHKSNSICVSPSGHLSKLLKTYLVALQFEIIKVATFLLFETNLLSTPEMPCSWMNGYKQNRVLW